MTITYKRYIHTCSEYLVFSTGRLRQRRRFDPNERFDRRAQNIMFCLHILALLSPKIEYTIDFSSFSYEILNKLARAARKILKYTIDFSWFFL